MPAEVPADVVMDGESEAAERRVEEEEESTEPVSDDRLGADVAVTAPAAGVSDVPVGASGEPLNSLEPGTEEDLLDRESEATESGDGEEKAMEEPSATGSNKSLLPLSLEHRVATSLQSRWRAICQRVVYLRRLPGLLLTSEPVESQRVVRMKLGTLCCGVFVIQDAAVFCTYCLEGELPGECTCLRETFGVAASPGAFTSDHFTDTKRANLNFFLFLSASIECMRFARLVFGRLCKVDGWPLCVSFAVSEVLFFTRACVWRRRVLPAARV